MVSQKIVLCPCRPFFSFCIWVEEKYSNNYLFCIPRFWSLLEGLQTSCEQDVSLCLLQLITDLCQAGAQNTINFALLTTFLKPFQCSPESGDLEQNGYQTPFPLPKY